MQKNIAPDENRQYQRIKPNQNTPIIIDINGSNFIEIVKARNISLGGINILVAHEFRGCEIEKQVKLEIKLPTPVNHCFSATGKIKHISGDDFGVNFLSMNKKGFRMLTKYLLFHQQEFSFWKKIRYLCHWY